MSLLLRHQDSFFDIMKKRAFKILLFFSGLSLLLVFFMLYHNTHEKNQIEQATQIRIKQVTRNAVEQIDTMLSQVLSIANALANDLGSGKLSRTQIIVQLEKYMEITPHLFGIGVAYVPYINNLQQRRQSPYYINRQGSLPSEKPESLQHFTVPCSDTRKMPTCVVFIEYTLDEIQSLIKTLRFGQTGYSFILSKQGFFISHPIDKYVKEHKTIFAIAELQNDILLKKLGERAFNKESGMIDYKNNKTGQSAWLFYQPIPSTGWLIGTLVLKNEMLTQTIALPYQQIKIGFGFIVFIVCLLALLLRADEGNSLWVVMYSASMLLLISLGLVWWFLVQSVSLPKGDKGTIIVDQAGLQQFLFANRQQNVSQASPNYIPTGVSIESIKFSDDNHVILSGHIWQKYHDEIHKGIARGFILPEAGFPMKITDAYRDRVDQTEVIGWFFEGAMRLQFDYSNYPLDARKISLLIHHPEIEKNVYLIPDIEAYKSTNPSTLPGIKHHVVVADWLMKSSFFHYQTLLAKNDMSHFYFTAFMQRDLLKPFLTSLLPLIMVASMLFAILLLLGRVGEFANIVAPLVALFIGVILAHIGLRKEIQVSGLFFIEYYYLVMYIAILLVAAIYFIFHSNKPFYFIQYRDGLVAKLLFLPLILVSLLGITILVNG